MTLGDGPARGAWGVGGGWGEGVTRVGAEAARGGAGVSRGGAFSLAVAALGDARLFRRRATE